MAEDPDRLEVLTRVECMQLLGSERVGRLGLSMHALPVVLPVNFALCEGSIIVCTGPGTKLDAALSGSVVAFEVDHLDEIAETGWSVLVRGMASVVTDPAELDRARSLGLRPWAGGIKDAFVHIATEIVSGRRLRSPEAEDTAHSRGGEISLA